MNAILFCHHNVTSLPLHHVPEALLPYCNIPLIAHILRFLDREDVSAITLLGADAQVRELVGTLSVQTPLNFAESCDIPAISAPTLVLRRLSLPRWDMGELLSLCDAAPVRLLHPDGSPTDAELHPAGSILSVPEQTVTAILCDFHSPQNAAEYLALQQELLKDRRMQSFRIGQGTQIGRGADISASSVIGSDCVIGDRAVIEDCVLGDGVQVGAGAVLRRCVVCRRALADRDVQLTDAALEEGTVASVQSEMPVHRHFIVDAKDGIHEGLPRWNNAASALHAGAAMTALGMRLAIGYASPDGENFAEIAAAGAVSQGAQVWQAGLCALNQLVHVGKTAQCDALLWVEGDAVRCLRPFSAEGMPLSAAQTRRLRQALEARISGRIVQHGIRLDARSLLTLWEEECRGLFHKPEYTVEICCGSRPLRETAQQLFSGGTGARIVLNLSEDGTQASAFSAESGMVRHEQLLLLALLSLHEDGEALALPADFHPAAEDFAARMGGRILRLFTPKVSPTAAKLWAKQGICMDGILLFAHILRVMEHRRMSLAQLAALLPPMYTAKREISTTLTPQAVEKLRRSNPDSAVRVELPDRRGIVRLLAYAQSAETAAELCGFWEKQLR